MARRGRFLLFCLSISLSGLLPNVKGKHYLIQTEGKAGPGWGPRWGPRSDYESSVDYNNYKKNQIDYNDYKEPGTDYADYGYGPRRYGAPPPPPPPPPPPVWTHPPAPPPVWTPAPT